MHTQSQGREYQQPQCVTMSKRRMRPYPTVSVRQAHLDGPRGGYRKLHEKEGTEVRSQSTWDLAPGGRAADL